MIEAALAILGIYILLGCIWAVIALVRSGERPTWGGIAAHVVKWPVEGYRLFAGRV